MYKKYVQQFIVVRFLLCSVYSPGPRVDYISTLLKPLYNGRFYYPRTERIASPALPHSTESKGNEKAKASQRVRRESDRKKPLVDAWMDAMQGVTSHGSLPLQAVQI